MHPHATFVLGVALSLAACGEGTMSFVPDSGAPPLDVPARDSAALPEDAEDTLAPPPDTFPLPDVPATGPCRPRAVPAGTTEQRLSVGGVERYYRLHLPRGYDPTRPAMLVLDFHGHLSNEVQQADWSNFEEASDARGFVVVHPRGINAAWDAGACCGFPRADDLGFVRALLDRLTTEYCVDDRRVFAAGFSNGAFFAHRLACELSDRFAAIAAVAGLNTMPRCEVARPVPVLHFHGTADVVVPYLGNPALGFPPALDSVRGWVSRDRCEGSSVEVFRQGDARCEAWQRCEGGAEVVFCTVTLGGHTWPGGDPVPLGGLVSRDLDATSYLLDFFARHPR